MKGGDQEGALKDYNTALGLNPRDPSVHNNLAWLYATAKDEKLQDKVKALEHSSLIGSRTFIWLSSLAA